MILWALAATAVAQARSTAMISSFTTLCVDGGTTAAAILSVADRNGWSLRGGNLPADFDPATDRVRADAGGTMKLSVHENKAGTERLESCGVSEASPAPDMIAAVQDMLGFAPAIRMAGSATFLATHDGRGWHDTSKLSREEFSAAKAAGHVYSVMINGSDTQSAIFSLNPRPGDDR
jgi:hypothetical protein